MNLLLTFIQKAIGQGVAILFGATGEIVTGRNPETSISGFRASCTWAGSPDDGAFFYENGTENPNGFVGFLIAIDARRKVGARRSPLQLSDDHACANQNVVGLALNHVAWASETFWRLDLKACGRRRTDFGQDDSGGVPRTDPGAVRDSGGRGIDCFPDGFLTYLSVVIALGMTYFLKRTRKA